MAGILHLLLHFFLFCNVTLVEKFEEILASFLSSWKGRKREEQGGVFGLHFETCRCKTAVISQATWWITLNTPLEPCREILTWSVCGYRLWVVTVCWYRKGTICKSISDRPLILFTYSWNLDESTSLKEHICSLYT